jgi:hypothetical protein
MELVEFAYPEGAKIVPTQELPRYEEAWIPESKLTKYALNTDHPKGRSHARLFRSELGIELQHWHFLYDQILERFPESQAILHKESEYGLEWEVPILVTGRNEAIRWVTTGWIVEYAITKPRLTTAYLERSRPNKELRSLESRFPDCPTKHPAPEHLGI